MRTGVAAITKQINAVKTHATTNVDFATGHTAGMEFAIEFVAGLLVSNNLRSHCWPIYKDMVNDMDTMVTSAEVANKAEYYRERLGGNYRGKSDAYWSKPNPTKSHTTKSNSGTSNRKSDVSASQQPISKSQGHKKSYPPRKYPPRWPCRHCKKMHYDDECPDHRHRPKPEAAKVMLSETKQEAGNNSSIFTPTTPFQ